MMIEFQSNHMTIRCTREEYIKAKTKDLREFGYPDLTEEQVGIELQCVLEGKPLDVIGYFIQGDCPVEVNDG